MINSIRIRLTLWFTGVLAVILIAFGVSTYLFLDYATRRQTDSTLRQIAATFTSAVINEQQDTIENPSPNSYIPAVREAMSDLHFRDYAIYVSGMENNSVLIENQSPDEPNPPIEKVKKAAADFATSGKENSFFILREKDLKFRVFARRVVTNGEQFSLIVSHALDEEEKFLDGFRNVLFISVPFLLIVVSLSGYFLARKSLLPVAQMSETASKISVMNLHQRLPVSNSKDELGSLAQIINALLERIEHSFETQRRFMADASHELRTPLAVVRGESEVALSRRNRPNEELYESLDIVHDESKRLTRIVEDLFTLARADSGHFKAEFKEIYLDELLVDCLRKVRVLADKRNVALNLNAITEMPIRGDENLLRRLLMNLLDNAIKYNREDGEGRISVFGEELNGTYRITISDTGIGIPKEQKSKIFERFYRADKARSHRQETLTSGAGLGLSIAQWIAEIHRGRIELVSSDNIGSTFAIIFPSKGNNFN